MKLTAWLRKEVDRLEQEIRNHSVFTSDTPATREQIIELRTRVAIHTFLKQQLLRREAAKVRSFDTREHELVAVAPTRSSTDVAFVQ